MGNTQGGSQGAHKKYEEIEKPRFEEGGLEMLEVEQTKEKSEKQKKDRLEAKKISGVEKSKLAREAELSSLKDAEEINKINALKLPETREEITRFIYFTKVLASVSALLFAKGLKKEQIKNFPDVLSINIDAYGLNATEKTVLKKLQEIAKHPESPLYKKFSDNWARLMEDTRSLSSNVQEKADIIKSEVEGKPLKNSEKSWVDKTFSFAKKNYLYLIGGALGAYGLYRLFKGGKKETEKSAPGESGWDTAWKWIKRGLWASLGVFLVGRFVLDNESVKKWLNKKGIDLSNNELAQFVVLLSKGKFSEAFAVLGGVENEETFDAAKGPIEKETGVKVRTEVLQNVAKTKYGDFMGLTSDLTDKGIALLPEKGRDFIFGGGDKEEVIAIRDFLKKHKEELKQKGMTDDMDVGKAFERLGYGEYKKPEEKKEEPEDTSGTDALIKNSPVIVARVYQWNTVVSRYKNLPSASKAMVDASYKRYWETYGWFKNVSYEKALGRRGEIEAVLQKLQTEMTGGKLTEAQKITNMAEQQIFGAHLDSLKSRRAFEAFRKEFGSLRSFAEIESSLKNFENRRALHKSSLDTRELDSVKAREFERLTADLNDIVKSHEVAISKEMRELAELSKIPGKEAEITARLAKIAETEGRAVDSLDKFFAKEGNADLMREALAHTEKGGWGRKIKHCTFSRNADPFLEELRPGLTQRVKSPFKFKIKGGRFILYGVGAGAIVSALSGKFEWSTMGKAAAGFVPVLAEYIDMKDAIRAFSVGDVKEGVLNLAFFVGDVASDLLILTGIGVGSKGVLASLKTVESLRGVKPLFKAAKETDAAGEFIKVISAEEKCAYKVYEKTGKVEKIALNAEDLVKTERAMSKLGKLKEMTFARQAFLKKCAKYSFATGAVMALSSAAVPIAEWAFGPKESAEKQAGESSAEAEIEKGI